MGKKRKKKGLSERERKRRALQSLKDQGGSFNNDYRLEAEHKYSSEFTGNR